MTSQSLMTETRECLRRGISLPRRDLLRLLDHLLRAEVISKEASTDHGSRRSIYNRGFPGVRKPREDLCSDLCLHSGVKALAQGFLAQERHPGPKGSVGHITGPSPMLARGHPTSHAAKCRRDWISSHWMRRTLT